MEERAAMKDGGRVDRIRSVRLFSWSTTCLNCSGEERGGASLVVF